MLCQTCQHRFDCLPAAVAVHDTHTYALLERLKRCDRYRDLPHVPQQTTASMTPDAAVSPHRSTAKG